MLSEMRVNLGKSLFYGVGLAVLGATAAGAWGADRPVIALIGYWPPSNEMVRQFSTSPEQNPEGWAGEDWEGRGYDVMSFFPEFDPPDCDFCGKGEGDFEVDYQDTSGDFWPIIESLQPVGIVTFGRGYNNKSWEIEVNTYNRVTWVADYLAPYYPTPCPPDDTVPAQYLRESTLPVYEIRDAVDAAGLGLYTFVDVYGDAGGFLCEFVGYHASWYQDIHGIPGAGYCVAGGHIHVGGQVTWDVAEQAVEVTVRTLAEYLDEMLPPAADITGDGVVDVLDLLEVLAGWGPCPNPPAECPADITGDGVVDVLDLLEVLANWT